MKKVGRCAYSYEVQNTQGDIVLKGCASNLVITAYSVVQKALVVAAMQAKDLDTTRFCFWVATKG